MNSINLDNIIRPSLPSSVKIKGWEAFPAILLITALYTSGAFLAALIISHGGVFQTYITSLFGLNGRVPEDRIIVFASLFYAFVAYAFTPAVSVVGVALGSDYGYSNKEPRHAKVSLAGLPHRMTASHQNLLEIFPVYALAAALTLSAEITPGSPVYDQLVNLLVLHVFLKTFIYLPSYICDLHLVRSLAHFVAIGALLSNLWKLTFRK